MGFQVLIKQEAHEDALAAYNYYEEKQAGLGERFLESLLNRYRQLSENPMANGFIAEDPLGVLRDVRLKRFPYVVVYEIIDQKVIVYSVHNTYRNPQNKLRKV